MKKIFCKTQKQFLHNLNWDEYFFPDTPFSTSFTLEHCLLASRAFGEHQLELSPGCEKVKLATSKCLMRLRPNTTSSLDQPFRLFLCLDLWFFFVTWSTDVFVFGHLVRALMYFANVIVHLLCLSLYVCVWPPVVIVFYVFVFAHLLPHRVCREPGDYQEGEIETSSNGKDGDLDAVKYVEVEVEHHGPE